MSLPRSFYFLRHGETEWNRRDMIQGWSDIPLNDTGRQQARNAAPHIAAAAIDRIVTSPLARALETAEIINTVLQKPLATEALLRERNYGVFEGKTRADFELWQQKSTACGTLPCEENGYPCPDNGERYADFKQRVMEGMAAHMENFAGENILFIAHGGVYRALRRVLTRDLGHSPNVKLYLFDKDGEAWVLREV